MAKPKTHYELCSQCTIQETFAALDDLPVETHIRTLMAMWSATYVEELRTVAALFQATTDLAERWADEQQPAKKKTAKLKAVAA